MNKPGIHPEQAAGPEQQARNWLRHQGVYPVSLSKMAGYCNHVFLLELFGEAYPSRSVLRLADRSLEAGLCPLADQPGITIAKYRDAERLGLAPPLILADATAGVMWLEYAGEQTPLHSSSFDDIRAMLGRLHDSALQWGGSSATEDLEHSLLRLRQAFAFHDDPELLSAIDSLLRRGHNQAYFDRPKVPVHSDLNPGNWLHDGQRWWLIDWDYAGLYPKEWDYAGLIVEHGWDVAMAGELLPELSLDDLAWFCCHIALLSWGWHRERGSEASLIAGKREQFWYWYESDSVRSVDQNLTNKSADLLKRLR